MKKLAVFALLLGALGGSLSAQGVPPGAYTSPASGSGGSSSSVSPNQSVFYVAQVCGSQTNCFQTSWDTKQDITCSWSNSATTITCSDGPFVATDVGKNIAGFWESGSQACQTSQAINSSNFIGSVTNATIATYISATQVTISQNTTGAAASAGCIYWGHPDDTALSAVDTAAQASPTCPSVSLPMGIGWMASPHFFTAPNSCIIMPESQGASYQTFGFQLQGKGPESTTLYWPPTFAVASCTHGTSGHACMGTGSTNFASMFFRDFGITGGSYNGGSATYQIIELGGTLAYGQLDHFLCSNFGAANSSARGLYVSSFHGTVAFSGFDGCGGTAVEIPSGGSLVVFQDSFEDSKFIQLQIDNGAGNVTSYGGTAYQPSPQSAGTSSNPVVMQLGGTFYMVNGDGIYSNGYTGTNLMGLRMTTNAGTFHCNGANVSFSGTGTGGVGVQIDTAAQTIYSSGCGFLAPSGQQGFILNSSTATVFDGGLNQFQNGQGWAILAGNVIGQANSANLIPLTTAKLVLSAGWGSTATKTAITGGDFPVQFTITNSGTGQGASPTITYTFPQVLASAPYNCTATQTGGTNAVGTFTSSSLSNTGVTFTFSLTPTASSTEIVQVTCVTP